MKEERRKYYLEKARKKAQEYERASDQNEKSRLFA
jgi:hypothetical protein